MTAEFTPMSLVEQFLQAQQDLTSRVAATNRETIRAAGAAIGQSLAQGGVLHVFGSGHSGIIAQEIVHRAGGLVPVSAVTDPTGGWPENIPGYGKKLFQRHAWRHGMEPGEVIIVISNSGKNAAPIEVALEAAGLGQRVVAITSLGMSQAANSEHASGKRLFECAEFVLDNLGIPGDAALDVPGQPGVKTAPLSTVSGALLINLLVCEAIQWMTDHGHTAPILRSGNICGGKEYNEQISARYRNRLSRPI